MVLSNALAISSSGVATTNRELEVVASNISNANTVGYTRKTLARQDVAHNGKITNVVSTALQRSVDAAAQKQFWTEAAATDYAATLNSFISRLDEVFGVPGGANALDTMVNDFSKALQKLAANPDDTVARLDVLNTAATLSSKLNKSTTHVQGLRQQAENEIGNTVKNLNETLQKIEKLDREIRIASLNGDRPVGLMDQRDRLISDVSKIVEIEVHHGENNSVRITTTNGLSLYDQEAAEFEFNAQTQMSPETTWDQDPAKRKVGTISLVGNGGQLIDVTGTGGFNSGKMGALLELRDKTLVEAQNQLDQLAAGLADAFGSSAVAGTAASAGPQNGFSIDIGALQSGDDVTVTYTDVASGETRVVTLVRVDSAASLPLSNDVTARTDDRVVGINFSGGMASIVSQISTALGGAFNVTNPSGNNLRILDDGAANTVRIKSVNASVTATSLQGNASAMPLFVDAGKGNGIYSGSVDGANQKVGFAGRIAVNIDLKANPKLLVQFSSTTGAGDQTRPNALYNALKTGKQTLSLQTGGEPVKASIDNFARQIISFQAEQAATAKTRNEGQQIVMKNVQARYEEGSKVNVDTELAKLLELQTAYKANARVMTAVREMMEALMRI